MNKDSIIELIENSGITLNIKGHTKHPKDYKVTKTSPDFDILHTLSGSYALIINDRHYCASANDTFFVPPNSSFTLIANEDSEQLFCHFSIVYSDNINLLGDFEEYKLSPDHSALICLLKEYFEVNSYHISKKQTALKAILKIFLLEMIFSSQENFNKFMSSNPYSFSNGLLNVINYIQSHPNILIKNSFLAEMAGFNHCYFSRYFLKHIGVSPRNYIENVKMNEAKQLFINNKSISVKEVAINLGFSDQFVFSKKFKKCFGISPSEFKRTKI